MERPQRSKATGVIYRDRGDPETPQKWVSRQIVLAPMRHPAAKGCTYVPVRSVLALAFVLPAALAALPLSLHGGVPVLD